MPKNDSKFMDAHGGPSQAINPNKDLNQQDFIPLVGGSFRMVSFNHILKTGAVDPNIKKGDEGVFFMNTEANDAFGRTWRDVREKVVEDMGGNPEIEELMAKDEWDMSDRERYEEILSDTISQRMDEEPGLSQYRSNDIDPNGVEHIFNMNDLSSDIENGTSTKEFDCEGMSVFKGTMAQSIDNMLPAKEGLKSPHNYYYTSGVVDDNVGDHKVESYGHAYVVSSATGNIIEGTADEGSYVKVKGDDFTFADHVSGRMAVTEDGAMYVADLAPEFTIYSHKVVESRAEAIENGDLVRLEQEHFKPAMSIERGTSIFAREVETSIEDMKTKEGVNLVQRELGTAQTGEWDGLVNDRFAQFVHEVQSSGVYQDSSQEADTDMVIGDATMNAMREMDNILPEMLYMIKELDLAGENSPLYQVGQVNSSDI